MYKIKHFAMLLLICLAGCSLDSSSDSSQEVVFVTTGSSFSPVIIVQGTPEVTWTWDDGTTDNSTTPVKNYGSDGLRTNRLKVKPWSAVVRINIGYDAGDGGSSAIEMVADQHVSSVSGLSVLAPTLRQWCSSYNEIVTLDFSNFEQLDTIECFQSRSLQNVYLENTPSLERACFEDCDLKALDLSGCPKLQDLRGALNNFSTINFGTIGTDVWHICVRENTQMINRYLFSDMSRFPNISELFIWNDNQAGELVIHSTTAGWINVIAYGNDYTSADFSGSMQDESGYSSIDLSNNDLASININGCVQIVQLNVYKNKLDEADIDYILYTLDTLGRSSPTPGAFSINISGNSDPSAEGLTHVSSLEAKGWTVTRN